MTIPGGYQHASFGAGQAPFDPAAGQTIETLRNQLRAPQAAMPPRTLSAGERKEAARAAQEQRYCMLCGGLHAAPGTPACPRLATFKLDGDGKVVEGTFWGPGTSWAEGRVVLAEDAAETEEGAEGEAGDGDQ